MYDETSLSLAMHCWLYMSSEPPSNDAPPKQYNDPYQLLRVILMDGARHAVTPKDAVKRAMELVEIDTIISCVGSRISDANTLAETLKSDLTFVSLFLGVDEATALAFAHARFYETMAEGVCRQLSSGVTSETRQINKMSGSIMKFVIFLLSIYSYTLLRDSLSCTSQRFLCSSKCKINDHRVSQSPRDGLSRTCHR